MTIDRRRDEFPTLAEGVYLLSHSLGPMPRAAHDAMRDYLDAWRGHTSEDAWMSAWWELSSRVGDIYGEIIGADPGTTIPTHNATAAMATIASCLNYAERPTVVTTALDFPSMGYLWRAQERLGARVRVVPSDDGISTPTDRLLDAIDETTSVVAVSHVSYCSSSRIDARAVVERAHEVGALVVLDVYQSAGVVEIDAAALGADALIGGSIKWVCGGPACGFLCVRADLIGRLEPTITGWIAHENPFAFDAGAQRYDSSIRRFAAGTPCIPALYAVTPGLEIIREIGVAAIAAESQTRTQRIIEAAQARGWPVNSPLEPENRGGTVMLGFPDAQSVAGALRERGVFVDWRPRAGARLSPHFFNTDEELERAIEAIAGVIGAASA